MKRLGSVFDRLGEGVGSAIEVFIFLMVQYDYIKMLRRIKREWAFFVFLTSKNHFLFCILSKIFFFA